MKATVLVPTHDHGPTLRYSVESALRQSVQELEIFIVGDGVPDAAREVIAGLTSKDPRVRFFDFPKGERHGEHSRHLALQEARGEIVCYLGDDDLWLPEHVERLHHALQRHNFANVLGMCVYPDGKLGSWYGDLQHPHYREKLRGKWNFMPLATAAHRLDFYRKLPHGWRPGPKDVWSDLHMYQQVLAHEAVDPITLFEPTVVIFPTPMRRAWTLEERTRELEAWMPRITEPEGRAELRAAFLGAVLRERAHVDAQRETEAAALQGLGHSVAAERDALRGEVQRLKAEQEPLVRQLHEASERLKAREAELTGRLHEAGERLKAREAELTGQLHEARQRVEALESLLERARAELALLLNSATWRARERLAASPLLRQPLTWMARVLAGRRPR